MNLFKTILFLALVFFINANSTWAKNLDEVADAVLITKLDDFITLKPTLLLSIEFTGL